jgi:hypothetical protein
VATEYTCRYKEICAICAIHCTNISYYKSKSIIFTCIHTSHQLRIYKENNYEDTSVKVKTSCGFECVKRGFSPTFTVHDEASLGFEPSAPVRQPYKGD